MATITHDNFGTMFAIIFFHEHVKATQ